MDVSDRYPHRTFAEEVAVELGSPPCTPETVTEDSDEVRRLLAVPVGTVAVLLARRAGGAMEEALGLEAAHGSRVHGARTK